MEIYMTLDSIVGMQDFVRTIYKKHVDHTGGLGVVLHVTIA